MATSNSRGGRAGGCNQFVAASAHGLLITAHGDSGLPMIYRTDSSEAVAQAVVAHVLDGQSTQITASDISAAYRAAGGNLRETLFKLYDVYAEARATR